MKQEYELSAIDAPLVVNLGFDTDTLTIWNNTIVSLFISIGDNYPPTQANHDLHILPGEFISYPVSGRTFCFNFNLANLNRYSYPRAKIVLSKNEPPYTFNSNTLLPAVWDRISNINTTTNISALEVRNLDFYTPLNGELGLIKFINWHSTYINSLLTFNLMLNGTTALFWDGLTTEKSYYPNWKIPPGMLVRLQITNQSGSTRTLRAFGMMEVYIL